MSRTAQRRVQWIAAALVLPALLFRALIPVGFMPMAGASGAVELGLCPGTVDGATFIFPAADPHAHHRHQDGHRSPPCPYALSGTAMPAPAMAAHILTLAVEEQPRSSVTTSVFLPTITRVQLPRAPPASA